MDHRDAGKGGLGLATPGASTTQNIAGTGGATGILIPAGPGGARVVGPGRRERTYQRRVSELESEVDRRASALATLRRELEVTALVERGTGRWADRIEGQLDGARQQANRLLVTLGALQRENETLRAELDTARGRLARLEAPAPRRGWRRVFGR